MKRVDSRSAWKQLTCIVPTGLATPLVECLHQRQINAVHVRRGRGASHRSGTFADEVEILSVLVKAEDADALFAFLYEEARIGIEPHRFMFQGPIDLATVFVMPEAPAEEEG